MTLPALFLLDKLVVLHVGEIVPSSCWVILMSALSLLYHRLDWPVRTLSFSHDGKMLASASEDHFIDIAEVETGN